MWACDPGIAGFVHQQQGVVAGGAGAVAGRSRAAARAASGGALALKSSDANTLGGLSALKVEVAAGTGAPVAIVEEQ